MADNVKCLILCQEAQRHLGDIVEKAVRELYFQASPLPTPFIFNGCIQKKLYSDVRRMKMLSPALRMATTLICVQEMGGVNPASLLCDMYQEEMGFLKGRTLLVHDSYSEVSDPYETKVMHLRDITPKRIKCLLLKHYCMVHATTVVPKVVRGKGRQGSFKMSMGVVGSFLRKTFRGRDGKTPAPSPPSVHDVNIVRTMQLPADLSIEDNDEYLIPVSVDKSCTSAFWEEEVNYYELYEG